MQAELDALGLDKNVTIIGVNEFGFESGNGFYTNGTDLPFLGTPGVTDVAELWGLTYRDVVVVNAQNEEVYSLNLTQSDLGRATNYDALKQQILAAAQ